MWQADLATWKHALSSYRSVIKSLSSQRNKSDLDTMDHFTFNVLKSSIDARPSPHITASEYSRVVKWKLKRGKWRPRLQAFADATTDEQVISASTVSFARLAEGDVDAAMNALIALKGCGPATASAILAVRDETIPFMSDELLIVSQDGVRKYTLKAYRKLISDVREKAAFLSELDEEKTWTPFDVEKAVFAAEHSSSLSIDAVNTSLFDVKKEGPVTNNQTEEKHPADLRAKKSSSNFSKKRPHVAEKSGSESHETKGLGGEISTAVEGEKEAADLKAGKKQSAINPADTNPQPLRRSKRRRAAAR